MKFDTLDDWLIYLESLSPSKNVVLGLERILAVAEKQDLNLFSCPVITVGGTNGKGTTVAGISALLSDLGLRVGSYYSPHLFSFTERIQIEQVPISEDSLIASFEEIQRLREDSFLTYFEFITLAALYCFQEAALDVLILEVGLGGRLDAVNCVSPDIAIITSIDYDHCDWLGFDLDSIAKEKAGIFRENISVILGREAIRPVLIEQASLLNAQLYLSGQDFDWVDDLKQEWRYETKVLRRLLESAFDESDLLAMATVACFQEKFSIEQLNLKQLQVQMPGRFLNFSGELRHIFDVAHNPHAARLLAKKVNELERSGRVLAIWSSFKDKDLQNIVAPFIKLIDAWFIAALENTRGANLGLLSNTLSTFSVKDKYEYANLVLAYEGAKGCARSGDIILVFGSFETVATVLLRVR